MDISPYLRQHDEAAEIVEKIQAHIGPSFVENPEEVAALLSQLAGKLSVHLAMEDNHIYPKALVCEDETLRTMAKSLQEEMSDLAVDFIVYVEKWRVSGVIEKAPSVFVSETDRLFSLLARRIETEESKFYPLVEKLA